MSELIEKLGVDWRLLLAQIVNFLLLFWVLKRFAYKPLAQFLEKRAKTIEKGLQDAEFTAQERERLRVLKQEMLAQAQKEAQEVIKDAQTKGKKEFEDLIQKAKERKEELVSQAKAEIEEEKVQALKAARVALGQLVITATQKVLEEKVDEEKDREIVEKALKEIKAG